MYPSQPAILEPCHSHEVAVGTVLGIEATGIGEN